MLDTGATAINKETKFFMKLTWELRFREDESFVSSHKMNGAGI